jgi:hypothetical protein
MPPIALTDSQLDAIVRASQPLAPVDRGKFLEAVAEALRGRVIGDGAAYLAIAEAQRKYFAPPVLERVAGTSSGASVQSAAGKLAAPWRTTPPSHLF